MSHLEILYQSLFTVIAEYYKIRMNRDISTHELMSKPLNELTLTLDKTINEMLGPDITREQILFYFRDLIALSHPYLNSTNLLTETECFHLHGALTDFIEKINELYNTHQNKMIIVTINETQRKLYGLQTGILRSAWSRLGTLIQSKILAPLIINEKSTLDAISTTISKMINDHQSAKRAVEGKLHTEIETLTLQNSELNAEVAALRLQLAQMQEKYTKTITSFESEITLLKEELIEAQRSSTARFIANRFPPSPQPTPPFPSWMTFFNQGDQDSDTGLPERLLGPDFP